MGTLSGRGLLLPLGRTRAGCGSASRRITRVMTSGKRAARAVLAYGILEHAIYVTYLPVGTSGLWTGKETDRSVNGAGYCRTSGNVTVSRMLLAPVTSMSKRSIPTPTP